MARPGAVGSATDPSNHKHRHPALYARDPWFSLHVSARAISARAADKWVPRMKRGMTVGFWGVAEAPPPPFGGPPLPEGEEKKTYFPNRTGNTARSAGSRSHRPPHRKRPR